MTPFTCVADLARRPGTPAALRRLLDVYLPGSGLTGNELEARFLELCAAAAIPPPAEQRRLGDHRIDFTWPDLRLASRPTAAEPTTDPSRSPTTAAATAS